ncbi:hypothetical protein O0I10_011377 [Lichtheimia ornata]|uniref:Ubiquitin-like domain-containing protein n=1 Tax=Lichtheimia ornata TaxID=688661 RepID=A0AAD7UTW5_9FUNG|nr:uncharacterized protein O0I10_011377 [Lichtheimia ornata]KAJ8652996.1 hypothetical protein O0I10_011377 [Lichtheimia ornata]
MTESVDYYDSLDVHVRWADGTDLVITISPTQDTVGTLKHKIQQLVPERTSQKYIRLIHTGRILDNDQQTLSHYGLGKFMRSDTSKLPIPPPSPVYIHCSVSDHRSSDQHSNDNANGENNTRPLMGFDRLRESGFNEEEIRDIRAQFHRTHGSSYDGEATEQTMALEEQWMENTGEMLPDGLIQGTYKEMMWGLLLGFFLGILCLFWFRESVFTRRHQMGIVAGMLINISFGVLHVYH